MIYTFFLLSIINSRDIQPIYYELLRNESYCRTYTCDLSLMILSRNDIFLCHSYVREK